MSTATFNKIERESKQPQPHVSQGLDLDDLFGSNTSVLKPVSTVKSSESVSKQAQPVLNQLSAQGDQQQDVRRVLEQAMKPARVEDAAGTVVSSRSKLSDMARKQRGAKSSAMCTLRNIPKPLVLMAMSEFPGASQSDAVVAYIVTHSPGAYDRLQESLTKEQRELVRSWSGDMFSGINDQLHKLVTRTDAIHKLLRIVETMSMYLTFDRLGFRNDTPDTVDQVDLNESTFIDFVIRAEGLSGAIQKEKDSIVLR